MKFELVNSYAATPAQVLTMLTDPEFRERVCEAQRTLSHDVSVTGSGPGALVVITRTQSMEGAPTMAIKVTGESVEIVQREDWRTAQTADFSMEIPGKPGSLRGGITLRETATGTDEVFSGDVKISIPLIGGKLEKMISDLLSRALKREGRVGVTWLAERA